MRKNRIFIGFVVCLSLGLISVAHAQQQHVFGTNGKDGEVNPQPSVTRNRKNPPNEDIEIETKVIEVDFVDEFQQKSIPTGPDCFATLFDCVEKNARHFVNYDRNCIIGMQQLKMDVIEHPGGNNIGLKFYVAGRQLMVIDQILIEDTHLLFQELLIEEIGKKGKVRFKVDRNVKQLPTYIKDSTQYFPQYSFTKIVEASEKARQVSANGVKQGNKEYYYIPFKISSQYNLEDVKTAITKGQIRVGVRATEFLAANAKSTVTAQDDNLYFMTCKHTNYHSDLN